MTQNLFCSHDLLRQSAKPTWQIYIFARASGLVLFALCSSFAFHMPIRSDKFSIDAFYGKVLVVIAQHLPSILNYYAKSFANGKHVFLRELNVLFLTSELYMQTDIISIHI